MSQRTYKTERLYDSSGRLRSHMIAGNMETIRQLRSMLTELEFISMDDEPCEECIKMRAVHLAVAVINGFELKDYDDGLHHSLSIPAPVGQDRNASAPYHFR